MLKDRLNLNAYFHSCVSDKIKAFSRVKLLEFK